MVHHTITCNNHHKWRNSHKVQGHGTIGLRGTNYFKCTKILSQRHLFLSFLSSLFLPCKTYLWMIMMKFLQGTFGQWIISLPIPLLAHLVYQSKNWLLRIKMLSMSCTISSSISTLASTHSMMLGMQACRKVSWYIQSQDVTQPLLGLFILTISNEHRTSH